jgi:GAF domain-containing protein
MLSLAALEQLAGLSRSETAPDAAMSAALEIVRAELGASDVALVYGGNNGFEHFGTCGELELTDTGLWWVNRELTTRSLPFGFHLHDGKVRHFAEFGETLRIEYVASLLPTRGASAQMLIARGPWPAGLTGEQAHFVMAAGPSLALLLERQLGGARRRASSYHLRQHQPRDPRPKTCRRPERIADDLDGDAHRLHLDRPRRERRDGFAAVMSPAITRRNSCRMLKAGRALTVRDEAIATDADVVRTLSGTRGSRNRARILHADVDRSAVLPLLTKDGTLGVLSVASHRPLEFTEREQQLLEGLTSQVAAAIHGVRLYDQRLRAEEALQRGEELLRATLESTADGILVVGEHGETAYFNARFAEMWSIPQDLLETRDDSRLLAFVIDQLEDGDAFMRKVRELYETAEESLDTIIQGRARVRAIFAAAARRGRRARTCLEFPRRHGTEARRQRVAPERTAIPVSRAKRLGYDHGHGSVWRPALCEPIRRACDGLRRQRMVATQSAVAHPSGRRR